MRVGFFGGGASDGSRAFGVGVGPKRSRCYTGRGLGQFSAGQEMLRIGWSSSTGPVLTAILSVLLGTLTVSAAPAPCASRVLSQREEEQVPVGVSVAQAGAPRPSYLENERWRAERQAGTD